MLVHITDALISLEAHVVWLLLPCLRVPHCCEDKNTELFSSFSLEFTSTESSLD